MTLERQPTGPTLAGTRFEPLLTVSEVATLARQSSRTILRRIGDGSIPALRLGRSIRVTQGAALAYLRVDAANKSRQGVRMNSDRGGHQEMKGYRVRVRELVEYDVMLLAESADDAKAIVETENPELDGGSRIEDGTPHRTVSLQAIGVEPYPDLE